MTVLVIPYGRNERAGKRMKLSFFPPVLGGKSESLCARSGELIRWKTFQLLRQKGAWIETDEPERVYAVFGLPPNTEGIVMKRFSR